MSKEDVKTGGKAAGLMVFSCPPFICSKDGDLMSKKKPEGCPCGGNCENCPNSKK